MNYRLIKSSRSKNRDIILFGRNESGKKKFVVKDFKPYFYVPFSESQEDSSIVDEEYGFTSIYGDDLRKVFVTNPSEVPHVREKFSKHWEADVPYARRCLVDKGIYSGFTEEFSPCTPPEVKPITLYLDIESYCDARMPDPEHDAITCFTVFDGKLYRSCILDSNPTESTYSGDEKWLILAFPTEKDLVGYLVDLILNWETFDVVTGWNVEWDLEYIEKRAKVLGLHYSLEGICQFDLLQGYKHLYRRRSYRLKDIALDEGLTADLEENVNYAELWKKDKPALIERNKRHVQWCAELDEKLKIIDYYWELRETAGLEDLEGTLYSSVLIDTMALRKAYGKWILPSRSDSIEHETYEGALVLQPEAGVYDSVAVFDLSRFYPNIIINEKLDPYIYNKYMYLKFGNSVSQAIDWNDYKLFAEKEPESLILDLVSEMIKKRDMLQAAGHKGKVAAIKGIVNSMYGVLAHSKFRLYLPEIPARVTEVARNTISSLNAEIEGWGYRVIYADTDSSFILVPKEELSQIEVRLNETLKKYGEFTIKLEKYFVRMLFTGAKKRYVGISESGELSVTGYDRIRSDSSNYTREIQEDVFRMILTSKRDLIVPYLQDKMKNIKSCKLTDIAVTKTLSRPLEEYDKIQQDYILAAKEARKRGIHFNQGDAIRILYAGNYPYKVAVFHDLSDLVDKPIIDWEKTIDRQIRNKVKELLPLVGLSFEETSGQKRLF